MVVPLILIYALITAIEIPSLVKRELKRETAVFIVLLTIGFLLLVLLAAGVKLISPVDIIENILNKLNLRFAA